MKRLADLAKAAPCSRRSSSADRSGSPLEPRAGIAGAVVATSRLMKRARQDRLHFDFETFMDVVDIVGGIVAVVGAGAAIAGTFARRAAALAKEGATLAELRMPRRGSSGSGAWRWRSAGSTSSASSRTSARR